jgi:tRNA A-37 threonylcarbamoyl transferase component Bud32
MDVLRAKHQQQHEKSAAAPRTLQSFATVPSEFVVSARVQMQRLMPVWMAKRRWLALRGSKSPILAAYSHANSFVMDANPIRVMLMDADTVVHAVGERGMVITSSRVRRNDTWAMTFTSTAQRRRMYELIKTWIDLAAFLQSLTGFTSIARSEHAVVYRCHDRADPRREFALKRVDRKRCANEINVTEKLVGIESLQPYLARYVCMFEDGRSGSVTIAMKYYKGGSLADRIREFGFLPDVTVRSVMASLCDALDVLHRNGILHLDVKAANVLFDADASCSFRNLKLVDFGSSRLRSEPPTLRTVAGTYGCMAPERFDGRCGPEADVYGAGVVLFHMVTGSVPFVGSDSYQVMAKNMNAVVSFAHPRWRRVAPQVRQLAERMLEKNPDHRITLSEALKTPWLGQAQTEAGQEKMRPADASPGPLPFPDPCPARSEPFAFFA